MNKHLYILSIISLIAKARKSIYYKIISWILKLILAINLLVTSGLFFSIVDLSTPLEGIYNFYSDMLGPYIKYLKLKLSEMFDMFNHLEKKYVTESTLNKYNSPVTNLPVQTIDYPVNSLNKLNDLVEDEIELKLNIRSILFYTSVGLILYTIYWLPGVGVFPPADILEYNFFNQSLINGKVYITKQFHVLKFVIFGDDYPSPTPSTHSTPDIGTIELPPTDNSTVSSPSTPIPSSSKLTLDTNTPTRIPRFRKIYINQATQTRLDGFTVSKGVEVINILADSLDQETSNLIKDNVNTTITKITD